jgi:hypothetical protein
MSRYSPCHEIYLVYRRGCTYVDRIKLLMTELDLGFIEVLQEDFGEGHAWRRYSSPTLMTVDGLDEEDLVVGGLNPEPEDVLRSATAEWLEARFYWRCIDFAGMRDPLRVQLTDELPAVAWLMLSYRERQTPKMYFTRTMQDEFAGPESAAVTLDAAVSFLFAGSFSAAERGAMQGFVLKNHDALLQYWNWKICTRDVLELLTYRRSGTT